jgi:hypothetical protein
MKDMAESLLARGADINVSTNIGAASILSSLIRAERSIAENALACFPAPHWVYRE